MDLPVDPTTAFLALLAFATVNTLGSVAFFAVLERALLPTRRLFDVPVREGQVRRERIGSAVFVLGFSGVGAALLSSGAIRQAPSGWTGAAVTFLGCMLSWDVYYYFFHRALHSKALGRFHAWHHASRVNTPWAALSMSPVEAAGWLFGLALWPVAASRVFPVVPEALVAWLVFFWWSNAMGHVNVELVPGFVSRSRAGRVVSHPVLYHALHHARYRQHYCFFLNGLDSAFGTVWPDTAALHLRVLSGEPLRRLGERGSPGADGERPS